eukprot:8703416-Alexandrium_andersonii.AAC.1
MLSANTKRELLRQLCSLGADQVASKLANRAKHADRWTIYGRGLIAKYHSALKAATTMRHEYYPSWRHTDSKQH